MKDMKILLLSLGITVLVLGSAILFVRDWNRSTARSGRYASSPAPDTTADTSGGRASPPRSSRTSTQPAVAASAERTSASPHPAFSPSALKSTATTTIHPLFESLLDPQTSFAQKESLWQQLTESGKLDPAIAELEQRARDNPADAMIPASLGRAYLQKAGSIQDVREQGVLGLGADKVFDQALALDPQNWDARYWKAMAMSHWPTQMGKVPEVMQHLLTLVEQQEAGAPRPEFVQSYTLLGEQYLKAGHADYAQQIWQRGATAFPNDPALKDKLAGLQ